tara:strand:+ start:2409 stop:2759 length:351 start_codon:yes stop_codon:yes gene_type:complete
MTAMPKHKTFRDKKYVASFKMPGEHKCLLTGAPMPDGAHIRYGFYGARMKPPDYFIVPIAHELHTLQHNIGEVRFWREWWWRVPDNYAPETSFSDAALMGIIKDKARAYYNQWSER